MRALAQIGTAMGSHVTVAVSSAHVVLDQTVLNAEQSRALSETLAYAADLLEGKSLQGRPAQPQSAQADDDAELPIDAEPLAPGPSHTQATRDRR